MKAIIFHQAFGSFGKGDVVTDPETVELFLTDNNRRLAVTPFNAPDPAPEAEPAPDPLGR
jgi:hypothetical protein